MIIFSQIKFEIFFFQCINSPFHNKVEKKSYIILSSRIFSLLLYINLHKIPHLHLIHITKMLIMILLRCMRVTLNN